MHTAFKVPSIIIWKWSTYYGLLPLVFNPLYSIISQQLFEKNFCNQSIVAIVVRSVMTCVLSGFLMFQIFITNLLG